MSEFKLIVPRFIAIVLLTCLSVNHLYSQSLFVNVSTTPASCGFPDGTVSITATGVPPFTYSVGGIVNNTGYFTGLRPGLYSLEVSDATGAWLSSVSVTSQSPPVLTAFTVTDPFGCKADGVVTLRVSSGTPPYQYSLDIDTDYQVSNIFSDLSQGDYVFYVKDANGCIGSAKVSLVDNNCPIVVYAWAYSGAVYCDYPGYINISGVSGGTAPYQFSMDGINYQSSGNFSSLPPGNHTVYIKDAAGLIKPMSVQMPDGCRPDLTYVSTIASCNQNDASLTVTANYGAQPYSYSIDGINYQSGAVFSNLASGRYTVTLKDAMGRIVSKVAVVSDDCPLNISGVATNSTCGNSNGYLVMSVSNGTPPYQFSMDGTNFQPGNSFYTLPAATYTVWAKDAAGKINKKDITVNNTAGPQINATTTPALCTNIEGTISISGTGGTTPYVFSIDGSSYQNSGTFNKRASGNYMAWVKDANGCITSQTTVVGISDNLSFTSAGNPTICEGTGAVLNCTSNGSSFSWSAAAGLNNLSILNPVASPVVTTKYYVTVGLGVCTKKDSVTVFVNPAPLADAGNGATVCYGQSVQLAGAGGIGYKWTPNIYLSNAAIADPEVTHPSSTTIYSLTVTDGNGCRSIQPSAVTITVKQPAKVFAGHDTSIVMNQPFLLHASDIDNNGFIQYEWAPAYGLNNSAAQNPIATLDRNTTYTVTATNAQGCSGLGVLNLKVYKGPDIYVPNAFSPNGDGRNDVLKATTVGITAFKYFNVYNRWGQVIFSTKDASKGWGGRVDNTSQATDTFVWIAEGVDEKGNVITRRGTVTLIRN